MTRRPREWSFVTLDHPTFETGPEEGAFWTRVIKPLLDLENTRKDDLCEWLKLVFAFCEGKPFVYYSQYLPSARIHALALAHKVHFCNGARSVAFPPRSWHATASGTSSG